MYADRDSQTPLAFCIDNGLTNLHYTTPYKTQPMDSVRPPFGMRLTELEFSCVES